MRKARVAPMNFEGEEFVNENEDPFPEEHGLTELPLHNNQHHHNSVTHYFDYKNIFGKKPGEIDATHSNNRNNKWYSLVDTVTNKVSDVTRKKWRTLANTVRQMNKVTKTFEEIRDRLTHDKQKAFNFKSLNSHCLLENHRSEELAAVEQYIKQKRDEQSDDGDWLIRYFIDLSERSTGDKIEKTVDFDLLEEKFESGLDVNFTDKHGQSILHEVARMWHVDVASFLLTHGADINNPDLYGRTPLHVAAAVDYPEMVEFLLDSGADIRARTVDENQTPIHYAAQNDASESLKVLLQYGADIQDMDYKGRTPLQLAAELDRSTTAELLIDEGAPAGVYDSNKLAALVVMIEKMPSVALKALDQFHYTNRASRKQYFYLNFLVPPNEEKNCFAKSPLQIAVEYKQYQLLLHPAFQRLVEVKWQRLGKWGALLSGGLNLIICLLWTIRLCLLPVDPKETYTGNYIAVSVAFDCLAVLAVVCLFISELREYSKANRITERYKEWREEQLQQDLKFAHPRWPEERAYLEREIRATEDYTSSYFKDHWNFLDWSTLLLMVATVTLHLVNMYISTSSANSWFRMIASVTLLSMWLRLLKYARPFRSVGLFVVMLSHVVTATLKILFLSLHIFIPYAAAFWMLFGIYKVKGYTLKNGELFYNLFQIGVVGDYNNEALEKHSPTQYQLLVGTFIFLGGIVLLNLFIALLSDTFQRVYDNAKATAQMQRAAAILDIELNLSRKRLRRHKEWIIRHCSPETLYYDDDVIEEETTALKKMTHQIRARVDTMHDILENKYGDTGNILNQSQTSLRTTEQISLRENKDIKYLVESLNELRADFYKSTIQTRAEIAGLGLMMRDLMDEKTNKANKKKKTKLPEISRKTLANDNTLLTNEENTNKKEKNSTAKGENIRPQRKNEIQYSEKGTLKKENEILQEEIENPSNKKLNSIHKIEIPHGTSNSNPSSEEKNTNKNTKDENSPENDFYEGYTFSTKSQSEKDALIKRTWDSIFTKIADERNNKVVEDEESSSSTIQLVKNDHLNPNASFNT